MKQLFALFLALLILGAPDSSSVAEESKKTRILFIGNSYTGQIRETLTELIKASPEGASTEMEFITPGGKTLEFHRQKESTVERIKKSNWDFVVLQDQSQTPAVFPDRFSKAAKELDELIDAAEAKNCLLSDLGPSRWRQSEHQTFPDLQIDAEKTERKLPLRCEKLRRHPRSGW